jgi:hypothetical protein
MDEKGRETNYNYYDSRELTEAVTGFMVASVGELIDLGIRTDVCFCFGTGKNAKFLSKLNAEYSFFKKIIALEHPRFIMQYKALTRHLYIDKYLEAFSSVTNDH